MFQYISYDEARRQSRESIVFVKSDSIRKRIDTTTTNANVTAVTVTVNNQNHQTMENFNELLEEYNTSNIQTKLDDPFTYIQGLPGKNIRKKLTRAFNEWMHISDDKLNAIDEIVLMLHNASLLIDDIQDHSKLRRGKEAAHIVYGEPRTLNAANYILFCALEKVLHLGHTLAVESDDKDAAYAAIKIYTEQMLELHRGQGTEIYWREAFERPTESAYKLMVIRKTGGLFMIAIELMKLVSRTDKDFTRLVQSLGLYFQIRDDYINLTDFNRYSDTKGFCEDITEGKYSFPIIHGLKNANESDANEIESILKERTEDVDKKKRCLKLLEDAGSFQYTRNELSKLQEQILIEVQHLGENKHMDEFLKDLGWTSNGQ